jgi:uncharacterized protein YbjT (DUF2867 family)
MSQPKIAEKRIIAVVGATGSQGDGLVRAILAETDHEFAVRALTRNARSAKAQELAADGAEVVEADLDNEASMVEAFQDWCTGRLGYSSAAVGAVNI